MRIRAGCILIEDGKLALIERHREDLHYFTFPGGGVDEGESHEEAAIREMEEETGLQVRVLRKIADVYFHGNLQPFFLVEKTSGEYGTGTGEEFGEYNALHGTYRPLWMPVSDVLNHNVLPRPLAELVSQTVQGDWPEEAVVIFEDPD